MMFRMILKDLRRNRIINGSLLLFIALAALLAASAAGLLATLFGSLDTLFDKSETPHYVQMHAGDIDEREIAAFANDALVAKWQISSLVAVDGGAIAMGGQALSGEAMDIGFAAQNRQFDYLLDLNNRIFYPADGEVGVPIYFMQKYGLRVGDRVTVATGDKDRSYRIAAFIRDAQMNPPLVTSKRLVVSNSDWSDLKEAFGAGEYLIAFRLTEPDQVGRFATLYEAAGLPQQGPAVTFGLFKLLGAMTDGATVAVMLLSALLLIAVAAFCLRFAMLAAMEEELREIGIMKAIGLGPDIIRRLYLAKYAALALVGSGGGLALSLPVSSMLASNIALYMGPGDNGLWRRLAPLLAVLAVFCFVAAYCAFVLRALRRITPVEALRFAGRKGSGSRSAGLLRISRSRLLPLAPLLALRDVVVRFKSYSVLTIVYAACAFLLLVPLHLLHTVQSPGFVAYMGAGQSDLRIDLQQQAATAETANRIADELAGDNDTTSFAILSTGRYKVRNADDAWESLYVESGDFTAFPLQYAAGEAPAATGQIALSSMSASQLAKAPGDPVQLLVNGREASYEVVGVYHDVTNGGRTAKAILPDELHRPLWYTINVGLGEDVDMAAKTAAYTALFPSAKVTGMTDYLEQTLGQTVDRLQIASGMTAAAALGIALLMTAMYLNMLLAKDAAGLAALHSIGFSRNSLVRQYVLRIALVLVVGLTLGSAAAGTIGEVLAGALGSMIGASGIRFVIRAEIVYLLCPVIVGGAVAGTAWLVVRKRKLGPLSSHLSS